MKKGEMIILPWAVRRILYEETDEQHRISMPELLAQLQENGMTVSRRSVYKAIEIMKEYGENIVFSRKGGFQGYYIQRRWTPAEILFLRETVNSSNALSAAASENLNAKLLSLLSNPQKNSLPEEMPSASKTDNEHVLVIIETLLEAIAGGDAADFLYYDITIGHQRSYRRDRTHYHLVPCAVVSRAGRWYCIFYSRTHRSFSNYRIDKMEDVQIAPDEDSEPIRFDLQAHMRDSFQMYHGEPDTVTVRFEKDMASIVYDEFGSDMIISEVTDRTFTANIRTSVTPTLISWLVQFTGRLEVLRPQTLIGQLTGLSGKIIQQYRRKEDEQQS